jgi:hypothetical protein
MGNGVTRQPVFGRDLLASGPVPDRSPGPLGWQDAADPDELMCRAGDTPGPVGTGQDLSSRQYEHAQPQVLEVHALEVSIDKVERFFYTVGLAEAQDFFAKRGFGSAEVELGRHSDVEARARLTRSRLMTDFQGVLPNGSAAILAFLETQEKIKAKSTESLNRKFSDAQKAGSNQVAAWGTLIKAFAVVRFGATVTRKVIGLHPAAGLAVTAVDIVSDVAMDAVDAANDKNGKVSAVVVTTAEKSGGQALTEKFNELVAEGFMTRNEKAEFEALFKNFRSDQAELLEKIEKIEKRLEAAAKGSKTAHKNAKQYISKLKKLGALRQKAGKTLMKGAAGKVVSLVHLESDVKEAWQVLSATWAASN